MRCILSCGVCRYTWSPKKEIGLPQECPNCKSRSWNQSPDHGAMNVLIEVDGPLGEAYGIGKSYDGRPIVATPVKRR